MRIYLLASVVLAVVFLNFFGFINYASARAISHCPETTNCPEDTICIPNPLCYNTIEELISAIIDLLFTLALIIVPMVIVIAGYFFVSSQGDPQKVATARNMVIYALVGLVIIMMAKGIINLINEIIGV